MRGASGKAGVTLVQSSQKGKAIKAVDSVREQKKLRIKAAREEKQRENEEVKEVEGEIEDAAGLVGALSFLQE